MARANLTIKLSILVSAIASIFFRTFDVHAENSTIPQPMTDQVSCVYPTSYEAKVMCRQIENQILASTIRIELHANYAFGQSYATVVGGRYLVTHNHFYYSLRDRSGEGYTAVTLRRANGEHILEKTPLSSFTIVHEDPETLVLAIFDENGPALFDVLGIPSARTIEWESVDWVAGMELAQVDWNQEKAYVDWVVVEGVALNGGVTNLQVNSPTTDGASGGGVFWQSYHVANNWVSGQERDIQTGEVIRLFSIVALNSIEVTRLGGG